MTALPLPVTARRAEVRWYPLALVGIMAAGVVLRLWGLTAHFLTYDEAFTALVAKSTLPNLLAATAGDVHPPLSYLVTWLFIRLAGGATPLTLRLPEVVMGCLAMPMV